MIIFPIPKQSKIMLDVVWKQLLTAMSNWFDPECWKQEQRPCKAQLTSVSAAFQSKIKIPTAFSYTTSLLHTIAFHMNDTGFFWQKDITRESGFASQLQRWCAGWVRVRGGRGLCRNSAKTQSEIRSTVSSDRIELPSKWNFLIHLVFASDIPKLQLSESSWECVKK